MPPAAGHPGDPLVMWVMYESPSDYPNEFVARKWVIRSGAVHPIYTYYIKRSSDIETIREELLALGLTRVPRNESDDANIVETWL